MNDLNEKRSVWIRQELLGTIGTLKHRGKTVRYRIPAQIDREIVVRFKGYGQTRGDVTGDLLLCLKVDRGEDIAAVLWVPDSKAIFGGSMILQVDGTPWEIRIPRNSRNNDFVRIQGAGRMTPFKWGLPFFSRPKGTLTVTLRTFPDVIQASYGRLESLSVDQLAIEGWIYRRIDFVLSKMKLELFQREPLTAEQAAILFNEGGWKALAECLSSRLGLLGMVEISADDNLPHPGICQCNVRTYSNGHTEFSPFRIRIKSSYLNDPFAVVAILTHELCHAVYARNLAPTPGYRSQPGAELLEEERTVDLLVFMFQLGEFQMRVARQQSITLGYFDQTLFERMEMILSRKRQVWCKSPPK